MLDAISHQAGTYSNETNKCLFLGILSLAKIDLALHFPDGVEGTERRISAAERTLGNVGVAIECGMGRSPLEPIPDRCESIVRSQRRL